MLVTEEELRQTLNNVVKTLRRLAETIKVAFKAIQTFYVIFLTSLYRAEQATRLCLAKVFNLRYQVVTMQDGVTRVLLR